jgi:hypothetical protein
MYAYAKPERKQGLKSTVQKKEPEKMSAYLNQTGIPDEMKTRFENLSGFSFDDVRVHYNSDKPAQLQSLAYTQGNQVYVAPGHEKHLGHELGHVVQQKHGVVRPTIFVNNHGINNTAGMETEADHLAGSIQFRATSNHILSAQGKDSRYTNTIQRLAINDTAFWGSKGGILDGLTFKLIKPYENTAKPQIFCIDIGVPKAVHPKKQKQRANLISQFIAPVVARVGNAVSTVLRMKIEGTKPVIWRNGKRDDKTVLNEFNVVYKCVDLGVYIEVEYSKNRLSYATHSFIQQAAGFKEFLTSEASGRIKAASNNGNSNSLQNAYAAGANLEINKVLGEPILYTDAHKDLRDKSIQGALLEADGRAGDALSMAAVEAARFKFLRSRIGSIYTDTYLIFGDYAITFGVLIKRFGNIVANHVGDKNATAVAGWQVYGLESIDVLKWIIQNTNQPGGDPKNADIVRRTDKAVTNGKSMKIVSR